MASHWAYSDNKHRRHALSSLSTIVNVNNDLFVMPWLSAIKFWQDNSSVWTL